MLPSSLEGLDADFGLGAGDLTAEGDFGELELDLGAGRATLSGSADVLTVDVSAGRADLDLADVRSAKLTVSAGSLVGTLTGDQPDAITLDVSAGSADLTVPEGDYDVSSDVSAGDFDNRDRLDAGCLEHRARGRLRRAGRAAGRLVRAYERRMPLTCPVSGIRRCVSRPQRTKRTSVSVSPRNGSVWLAPSSVKPLRT